MRPRVQATADRLIAALAALPPGETTDIRQALSVPLTMTVICDLFGVPDGMRKQLGAAIDGILDTTVDLKEGQARNAELHTRLAELLRYKRAHPGSDLTSDLLTSSASAEQPPPELELVDTLFLMLGAGYETAVNLITSAVTALLHHPGHLARIRQGAFGWEDVVEETLRHEGPVMHMPLRYPIEDIDLGEGVVIRKGEPILLAFAAAGRDPELHPDPDTFDPAREDKEHLAFGYGPHFCLGAHLARLEAHIALSTLFARLPHLTLADPDRTPGRIASLVINGPTHLDVLPTPLPPA